MDIKRILLFALMLSVSTNGFAGGIILKGETFRAKEDFRYFTLEESKKLLKDLAELDILRQQNALLKENEKLYIQKISQYEAAIEAQKQALSLYEKSIKKKEEEVNCLQAAVKEYQGALILNKETIKLQQRRERRNRLRFNIEKVFWGVAGACIGHSVGTAGLSIKLK